MSVARLHSGGVVLCWSNKQTDERTNKRTHKHTHTNFALIIIIGQELTRCCNATDTKRGVLLACCRMGLCLVGQPHWAGWYIVGSGRELKHTHTRNRTLPVCLFVCLSVCLFACLPSPVVCLAASAQIASWPRQAPCERATVKPAKEPAMK